MIRPLHIETDNLLLHPFMAADLARYEQLVTEIFDLLSNEDTLRYIPDKELHSLTDAEVWLRAAVLNAHSRRNTVHFLTDKRTGKLIGVVDIIPPLVARQHYQLSEYPYFIEFYLAASAKGKSIMTMLLPQVMTELSAQGISQVAAVVNRKNKAASKVLNKAGFIYQIPFDALQDFYRYRAIA